MGSVNNRFTPQMDRSWTGHGDGNKFEEHRFYFLPVERSMPEVHDKSALRGRSLCMYWPLFACICVHSRSAKLCKYLLKGSHRKWTHMNANFKSTEFVYLDFVPVGCSTLKIHDNPRAVYAYESIKMVVQDIPPPVHKGVVVRKWRLRIEIGWQNILEGYF